VSLLSESSHSLNTDTISLVSREIVWALNTHSRKQKLQSFNANFWRHIKVIPSNENHVHKMAVLQLLCREVISLEPGDIQRQ